MSFMYYADKTYYTVSMANKRRARQEPLTTLILITAFALFVVSINAINSLGSAKLFALLFIFGLLVSGSVIVTIYIKAQKNTHSMKAVQQSDIDAMTGEKFERYVGALLQSQGFKPVYTNKSGDFGVDIVATKKGISIAVQCKRMQSAVGEAAIQQAVAGMLHYKCNKSMVVTNSTFTRHAKALALSNHCDLVDSIVLGSWILAFRSSAKPL
jgi:restriction system protein